MEIIYENKKIDVNINECITSDNMGRKLDSLKLTFADIKSECSTWELKKGQSIKIIDSPFSSGVMYVDDFGVVNNKFYIKALPIKKKLKTKKSRSWENVTFIDIAKDIAEDLGLILKTYDVTNYKYERVDQIEKGDIEFLNYRCMLEGYVLKITNDTLNIISEKFIESQNVTNDFCGNDFIDKFEFKCDSINIFGGCEIFSNSKRFIQGSYILKDSTEDIIKINDLYVSSTKEAERFSKNILRSFNKYEYTGMFYIKKNTNIAAGNIIAITGMNSFNGKYVVENLLQYHCNGKTKLKVRKVLEGY